MTLCIQCGKRHAYRKYGKLCKDCHQVNLSRERHDKICADCNQGFLVTGLEKWKKVCPRCSLIKNIPETCLL